MIGNYWNSALRNLMKRKVFSFINIFGLAVGMASALLILTYVNLLFGEILPKRAHFMRAMYRRTIGQAVPLAMLQL